jgi:hypothetical protein
MHRAFVAGFWFAARLGVAAVGIVFAGHGRRATGDGVRAGRARPAHLRARAVTLVVGLQ